MTTATSKPSLPTFEDAVGAFERNPKIREHASGNLGLWRSVHGGLALVRKRPLVFDPLDGYWYRPERRILVSYFSAKLGKSYLPAAGLRSLAWKAFTHFDQSRVRGAFPPKRQHGEGELRDDPWREFVRAMRDEGTRLPDLPEYERLRAHWRTLKAPTFRDDLLTFLTELEELEDVTSVEPRFANRLPWLPYLGLPDLEQLLDRQRYFLGFHALFTSTNAYKVGGAQTFGPILANNNTRDLVGFAERWAAGEKPRDTGFLVEGSSEKRDASGYSMVVELYGLLNLHRIPFHNSVVEDAFAAYAQPGDTSIVDRLERIGEETRRFLAGNSERVPQLARWFREGVESAGALRFVMEGIEGKKDPAALAGNAPLADALLAPELQAGARERVASLTVAEAATAMLHLVIDSVIYEESRTVPEKPAREDRLGATSVAEAPPEAPALPSAIPATARPPFRLAPALRPVAQDALGYLRAGHHVLLAGAPGTGKTTVAQFVAHAWNSGLERVADTLPWAEAPATTVGNSAWSPFHTIGGMVPDGTSRFVAHRGIFIDPAFEEGGAWRLLDGCLVLDEMNRADLDRCIGELYPLLTRSVERVAPAGIPAVRSILLNERFRIVATVNDATVDDIVFPISEGLARRFIRLELPGAELSETLDFVRDCEAGSPENAEAAERQEASASVLEHLFDAARAAEFGREAEEGWRIPLGVGYFSPLRSWCRGGLVFSTATRDRETSVIARDVLRVCLSAVGKHRKVVAILKALQTDRGS